MYKFILQIQCVHIYICILLAFVKLLCHFLFVFVWRHCKGRRKRLASKFKILSGFHPPLNRLFNMKFCRAIWRFITKNELYGFIILYKTINVINVVIDNRGCFGGIWSSIPNVGDTCYYIYKRIIGMQYAGHTYHIIFWILIIYSWSCYLLQQIQIYTNVNIMWLNPQNIRNTT